jgi:hypothetical protein
MEVALMPNEHPDWRVLVPIALAALVLEWLPGVLGPYGWFIDEFYYLACASHPAWGYVDHPPLSVALLAGIRALMGDSLLAVRCLPAALGAATAIATGLLARRLGAGTFGQALAALGIVTAGVPMVMFSFYSMNALDMLLWVLLLHLLVAISDEDRPRLWIPFGALLGLAFLNKHTVLLLPLGVLPAMLLTGERRHLARPLFAVGLAVAAVIALPNVLWQASNGWPSLEFYRNANLLKNNPTPAPEVVLQQVLFMNPLAFPVWLAGLVFLLGRGREGRLRHLGIAYLLLLAMLAIGQKSRPDRLTPIYPVLFAAGGVTLEAALKGPRLRWLRPVTVGAVLLGGLVFLPVGIPLLSPAFVGAYGSRLGLVPQIESGAGKRSALPQWLSDRLDWQPFVEDVVQVVERIPPAERAHAAILAPSYGQAGALERLGRGRNLPPVFSGHNNYVLWGPPPDTVTTLVVVGFRERTLARYFDQVVPAGMHRCTRCTPWRDEMPIWIVRRPRQPLAALWSEVRNFE